MATEMTTPTSAGFKSGSLIEHMKTVESKGQELDNISFLQPCLTNPTHVSERRYYRNQRNGSI